MRALAMCGLASLLLWAGGPARAEEQAEQIKRDAARLAQVKTIAVAPVVVQVRMDRENKIPDPNRVAARVAAQTRLISILDDAMKSSKYKLIPVEAATLAMREAGWQPTDLYVTKAQGTWDSPGELFTNRKKDEAALLGKWADLKQSPDELSLLRYKWHDLPDTCVGLASFGMSVVAKADIEKTKALGKKLGADAVLLLQVADLETHEGAAGILGMPFKSTRVHIHATLVASDDGAVIWQARARGVKSQKAGLFTGNRAYAGEDRKAIEGADQAVDLLVADLCEGKGAPLKP